ncbi:DNA-binding response regulator [Sphaerisporangium melleum]|uniref:DNA-binding response regulator n=1 Tax=Sphaerisporangium melleum TaxID=321316 RepID=A0A917VPN2_9ACTN|nr:response regulator transcription factor [Sphaerisporangium melleum]GGL06243.1 DNA-binding response regulator [Sphaerisporangium melleum]GII74165.1 DNA-binding response regulator [Sphaerisporangium melleum]
MIRILVAEHLPLVRRGLVASLNGEKDLMVIADVASGEYILPAAMELAPDVAVIDMDLPDVDGITAAERLHQRAPQCKVLLLSARPNPGQVRRAFAAHALGFLSTNVAPEHLADGIRRVASGRKAIDSDLAIAALTSADNPLTPREQDVLRIAAQGASSKEIAAKLYLSVGTVRNHLSRIIYKTGARNRSDAVRVAAEAGWL